MSDPDGNPWTAAASEPSDNPWGPNAPYYPTSRAATEPTTTQQSASSIADALGLLYRPTRRSSPDEHGYAEGWNEALDAANKALAAEAQDEEHPEHDSVNEDGPITEEMVSAAEREIRRSKASYRKTAYGALLAAEELRPVDPAITRVLALHVADGAGLCSHCVTIYPFGDGVEALGADWPCATVNALTGSEPSR